MELLIDILDGCADLFGYVLGACLVFAPFIVPMFLLAVGFGWIGGGQKDKRAQ